MPFFFFFACMKFIILSMIKSTPPWKIQKLRKQYGGRMPEVFCPSVVDVVRGTWVRNLSLLNTVTFDPLTTTSAYWLVHHVEHCEQKPIVWITLGLTLHVPKKQGRIEKVAFNRRFLCLSQWKKKIKFVCLLLLYFSEKQKKRMRIQWCLDPFPCGELDLSSKKRVAKMFVRSCRWSCCRNHTRKFSLHFVFHLRYRF